MNTLTALHLLREGYNVADNTMIDLGAYLTVENAESETLAFDEFIMHDPVTKMSEKFYFTTDLLLDPELEWYLVYTDSSLENHYLDINVDVDDDGVVSDVAHKKIREAAEHYEVEEKKNNSKEDNNKVIKEKQKRFFDLTMKLLTEADFNKKIEMYDELTKITNEIDELYKENK